MTISSDAFAQYFASVPCFKHQLKTWHEHEREIFLHRDGRLCGTREQKSPWVEMRAAGKTDRFCESINRYGTVSPSVNDGDRKMSGIEAHASGEAVEFQIKDDNGELSLFRLDRRLTTTLILLALQELALLPDLEGELLQEADRPLLQGRPSVQVGIGESGDVLLEFRLDPATMQFLIDDEMATALVQQVSEVMATPRSVRYQPNKN